MYFNEAKIIHAAPSFKEVQFPEVTICLQLFLLFKYTGGRFPIVYFKFSYLFKF